MREERTEAPAPLRRMTAVWAAAILAIFFLFTPPAASAMFRTLEYTMAASSLNTLGIKTTLEIAGLQPTEWGLTISRFALGLAILFAVYIPRTNRASSATLGLLLPFALFAGVVSIVWIALRAQMFGIHESASTFYVRNGCFLLLAAVFPSLTRMKGQGCKPHDVKPSLKPPPSDSVGGADTF